MAYVKISNLPVANTLDGTETVPIVQGGVTRKTTVTLIKAQGVSRGRANLVAGSVVIPNTLVTSTSNIFLTGQDSSVTGALRVNARAVGVSFTITSSNGADTGVVAWSLT